MIPILIKPDAMLSDTLQSMGTITHDQYFFLPFWFHKQPNGDLFAYHLDSLPENIKRYVELSRNPPKNKK